MPRIVHFGKYYFPDVGGIESVTFSLARGAAEAGHQVTVVCFEKLPTKREEILDGVQVIRAPIAKLISSQPLGFKYIQLCLKAARNADIVHLHVPNMVAAFCALLLNKKTKILVHWHSDVLNKGFLGKLFKPLEKALLKRANSIVATSRIYADASPTLRHFHSKVTVVPIGVPDISQSGVKAVDFSKFDKDIQVWLSGKKLILSVGRLVSYKGFDVLIEAAKYLRDDAAIIIVGSGPLHTFLMNAITTTGLTDRVLMVGRLSDEMLHALFTRASIFCLPSTHRAEAFGVVLLEAMAFGLPIVATTIHGSGVPWVNQHGLSGINVPVGDAEELANACNIILSSEHKRAQFSNGAQHRFLTEFTEEASVKKIMATYDQLISTRLL